MRYAAAFLLLSAGCAIGAVLLGGVGWLLLWPAVSFLVLSLAYAGIGAAALGKRSDGSLAGWAIVLHFPYFALTWSLWHVLIRISPEPPCDEIIDGVWLGRRQRAHEVPDEVKLIVDLTAEFAEPAGVMEGRTYVCVPTLDGDVPSITALREVVERLVACPDPVLVHCASGHGRSALVIACILIAKKLVPDTAGAEELIRAKRPGVGLNASQRRRAEEFAAGT